MLLWRLRPVTDVEHDHVECHLIRRDMEYRLSVRTGKKVVLQETHRTPTAAAKRAENLRRQAIDGMLLSSLNGADVAAEEAEEL